MAGRISSRIARLKKLLTSFLILLIFTFPIVTTGRWVYGIATGAGGDPRTVYTQAEVPSHAAAEPAQPVRPFEEPLITVTFDDGWESIYANGLPVFQKHGILTTQYVLGGQFEHWSYMSREQVRDFQQRGHDIASHTMTHRNLTMLSDADREWELGEAKRVLESDFGQMKDFASPLGAQDKHTLQDIRRYYRSNRNTVGDTAVVGDEDINTAGNFNIYSINAFTVRKSTTVQEIERLIAHAEKTNGWLILTYHQVDNSSDEYAVTPEVLDEHLAVVGASGHRTPTMAQVLDALSARRQERF